MSSGLEFLMFPLEYFAVKLQEMAIPDIQYNSKVFGGACPDTPRMCAS